MDYGEKWGRETEGQAADAVTGVFPSLWGFPCACGSRDQLLGHGGLSWCCMKVRQEGPCKEPEWHSLVPEEWMLPSFSCPKSAASKIQLFHSSQPCLSELSLALSALSALPWIHLCCSH